MIVHRVRLPVKDAGMVLKAEAKWNACQLLLIGPRHTVGLHRTDLKLWVLHLDSNFGCPNAATLMAASDEALPEAADLAGVNNRIDWHLRIRGLALGRGSVYSTSALDHSI